MKIEKYTGMRRLLAAAKNSFHGFRFAFKRDEAVRQEFVLIAILLPIAFIGAESVIETLLLLSGLFAVLITELLNTAIEVTIDRISLEYHDLSKAAKDIASAAVLLSLIYCALVWFTVLF
jgi:diacylglycerol kinase (ATP)